MKLKSYPEYKDSGVDWLGQIPKDWDVLPFKWRIARNDGGVWGEDPNGVEDTIVLRSTEQTVDGNWKIEDPAFRSLSKNEQSSSTLVEGDLLITKSSGSSLHIGKTTLVTNDVAKLNCCYSNFMQRIRTRSLNPKLAWYLMNNEIVRNQFDFLSNSTTGLANLNSTMIGQVVIQAPSIHVQETIVKFLDRETSKLDTLISKQEHLIELLQEKRQAVISHAVTKGLDPDAKMKDSGVEWLGMVPERWGVRRLKFNLSLLNEKTDRRDFSIGLENIEGWSGKFIKTETEFEGEGIAFNIGDILFGKLRPYLAKVYHAEFCGEAVGDFHVMRPNDEIFGRFAQYQMLNREFISIVDGSTYGAKMPRASWEFVGGMVVTCPPKSEQESIAAYLDVQTTKIDTLIDKAKRSIELAKEHRTALISAAVTGKIDVRNTSDNLELA